MFRERPPARVVTAASPRTPGLTPERPAAPPRAPVGRRPSRVRVHAGDRCVAPAKTKPRKRQAVNEATDMSSLSIDAVQWSDAGYSVTELASCRGRDCPLIVKVTRSYAGELSAELQVDQVLQIHDCAKQTRVRAVDTEAAQTLSIPASYALDVVYVGTTRTSEKFEHAALTAHMPVHVCVVACGNERDADLFRKTIKLCDVTEDVFLRANYIVDGWIDQTRGLVIPSFLGVEFAVAVGMRGATAEEWLDYRNMYSRSVRHLNFDRLGGYPDIVVLPEGGHVGEVRTSRVTSAGWRDVTTEPDVTTESDVTGGGGGGGGGKEAEYLVMLPGGREADDDDVEEGKTARAGTPSSDGDEEELGELFASVIKEAEESGWRPVADDEESAQLDSSAESGFGGRRGSVKKLLHGFESFTANTAPAGIDNQAQDDVTGVSRSSSGVRHTAPPPPPPSPPPPPPRAIVVPTVQQQRRSSIVAMETSFTTELKRRDVTPPPSRASLSKSTTLDLRSIDDIPADVSALSVGDVGGCLRLLNLEAHVESFRQRQVDGALLSALVERELMSEFKLTPFNASKLLRFVRGWRPRI